MGNLADTDLRYETAYSHLPIENIIDLVASGVSIEEIISDYPESEKADFLASLAYAKTC